MFVGFVYFSYQTVNYTAVKLMCNTKPFFPFLCWALFLLGYLHNYTVLSKFVQFVEDRVRLLECSPASCLAPRNHCEEKREKFITHRINMKLPSHFGFDTCRHSVGKSIFLRLGEWKIVSVEGKLFISRGGAQLACFVENRDLHQKWWLRFCGSNMRLLSFRVQFLQF